MRHEFEERVADRRYETYSVSHLHKSVAWYQLVVGNVHDEHTYIYFTAMIEIDAVQNSWFALATCKLQKGPLYPAASRLRTSSSRSFLSWPLA